MEAFGYLATAIMGIVLGMTGGGGSILTVPILVYLFGMSALKATSYSLFVVGVTSAIGGLTYFRSGHVDLKTGMLFAVPSFVGVYFTRSLVLPMIPDLIVLGRGVAIERDAMILLAFAALMLVAATSMIRKALPRRIKPVEAQRDGAPTPWYYVVLSGVGVSLVTGLVGAGGGFLIIPALTLLLNIPMRVAVGTSLAIIAANSLIGFAGDLQRGGNIDWLFLWILVFLSIVGLLVGAKLAKRVSEAKLKLTFGAFVFVMGALIFSEQMLQIWRGS